MAAKDNSVKQLTGGIKMLFKNNKVTHLEGNLNQEELSLMTTKSIASDGTGLYFRIFLLHFQTSKQKFRLGL